MFTKQCAKCNKPFDCCSDGSGCWCEQYTVPQHNLDKLRAEYTDCLCPQCLAEYQLDQEITLDKE